MSIYDPRFFCLVNSDQHNGDDDYSAQGIAVLEVDDTWPGGNEKHVDKMNQLRGMIQFGHWHILHRNGPH
eukprot:2218832-Pyramimonas_sp.AAC.1